MDHELENAQQTAEFRVEMLKEQIKMLNDIIASKDQELDRLTSTSELERAGHEIEAKNLAAQN